MLAVMVIFSFVSFVIALCAVKSGNKDELNVWALVFGFMQVVSFLTALFELFG